VCIMEILLIVDTELVRNELVPGLWAYWSVVSLNCIIEPSGAVFV
jgi:hypothetical protein